MKKTTVVYTKRILVLENLLGDDLYPSLSPSVSKAKLLPLNITA